MAHVFRIRAAKPNTAWPDWPFPSAKGDVAKLKDLRARMDQSFEGDRLEPALLNEEQERVLRAELKRAAEAVVLARQMPDYPYGKYPIKWSKDFVSTMLPHVQEVRSLANLLDYDSRLQAHDNDIAAAFRDAKAIIYGSRAIGDEEIIISHLVRIACDSVAIRALERSLALGQTTEDVLADLQQTLIEEERVPFFLMGMRGERACLDQMLEHVQNGEITFSDFRRIMFNARILGSVLGVSGGSNNIRFELDNLKAYLTMNGERARQMQYLTEIIELSKLPTWEALKAIEDKNREQAVQAPLVVSRFAESTRLYVADLRAKALLRTAFTGLAIERFRLAKGHWPVSLGELVPRYLSEIPRDPFDGAPLRLVCKEGKLIIYSVSLDRIDQGGTLLADPNADGSDVGFVLHDSATRRRPGKPFQFPDDPAAAKAGISP